MLISKEHLVMLFSVEAILGRFLTAIDMWLRSQGDMVKLFNIARSWSFYEKKW